MIRHSMQTVLLTTHSAVICHVGGDDAEALIRTVIGVGDDNFGAGNEIRTRDPNLGKVVLYQLSYSRIVWSEERRCMEAATGIEPV